MVWKALAAIVVVALIATFGAAQEQHSHPAPERLGKVVFPTSCTPSVQTAFERAVALLHSFAYNAAEVAFTEVAERDPGCAMAQWGIAMTHFHQLWEPQIPAAGLATAQKAIDRASRMKANDRERQFITALLAIYKDASTVPYRTRALRYERAMQDLAARNSKDTEAQVFYALALLATAPPTDRKHVNQHKAAEILEPLYRENPQHPGLAHYLIHSYDNSEMARRGLKAARDYSQIAPSAPHALHMPSHIFTRLGLWDDSIQSNLAARRTAHQQGDLGEELHAMDYLVYAYLQAGRDDEAAELIAELQNMQAVDSAEFKVGYAYTAMPVRYAVERGRWEDAARINPARTGAPQVVAIAVWGRGIGLARSGHPAEARKDVELLNSLEAQLRAAGNEYWATQTQILRREVSAWVSQAEGHSAEAAAELREAADQEDEIEKLPVTPGPVVPAREQLGDLLLEQGNRAAAAKEFERALAESPGRRRALAGAKEAAAEAR